MMNSTDVDRLRELLPQDLFDKVMAEIPYYRFVDSLRIEQAAAAGRREREYFEKSEANKPKGKK